MFSYKHSLLAVSGSRRCGCQFFIEKLCCYCFFACLDTIVYTLRTINLCSNDNKINVRERVYYRVVNSTRLSTENRGREQRMLVPGGRKAWKASRHWWPEDTSRDPLMSCFLTLDCNRAQYSRSRTLTFGAQPSPKVVFEREYWTKDCFWKRVGPMSIRVGPRRPQKRVFRVIHTILLCPRQGLRARVTTPNPPFGRRNSSLE